MKAYGESVGKAAAIFFSRIIFRAGVSWSEWEGFVGVKAERVEVGRAVAVDLVGAD